jgi:hypothetical protein
VDSFYKIQIHHSFQPAVSFSRDMKRQRNEISLLAEVHRNKEQELVQVIYAEAA